ncbi:MAG: hypothetical protein RMK98_08245, partial [Bacteroidia bacterium]|nr:hypothetical protein [Bacteroidia bacterium]
GNYTDPSINWTATSKPQTRFYSITQTQFDGANDSTAIYNLVNGASDLVKYPGNGDGARATIHTEDNIPSGATGPHEYLAFRQTAGSRKIWGIIKRNSAGSGQASLQIKAIIVP